MYLCGFVVESAADHQPELPDSVIDRVGQNRLDTVENVRYQVAESPERRWKPDRAIADTPDRKSTRLNSSHTVISYAVFCLKKKIKHTIGTPNIHQNILQ